MRESAPAPASEFHLQNCKISQSDHNAKIQCDVYLITQQLWNKPIWNKTKTSPTQISLIPSHCCYPTQRTRPPTSCEPWSTTPQILFIFVQLCRNFPGKKVLHWLDIVSELHVKIWFRQNFVTLRYFNFHFDHPSFHGVNTVDVFQQLPGMMS